MTATEFRQLALALPEAAEASHMGHPDFRVRGKIFATLGHPSRGHGVVRLSPTQQQRLLGEQPDVFAPSAGAWGRKGWTSVLLRPARKSFVGRVVFEAWSNTAPKTLVRAAAEGPVTPRRRL